MLINVNSVFVLNFIVIYCPPPKPLLYLGSLENVTMIY